MSVNSDALPKRHWRFPEAARFGRVIPKEKIYQQALVSAQVKQQFIDQIAQIKWAYKLAESTLNLAKTEQVNEIEVIRIKLKGKVLDQAILSIIDRVIPHQTLFILERQGLQECTEHAYIAAHKHKVESVKEKWQQSQYLQTSWFEADSLEAVPLPTATNLQRLYEALLDELIPEKGKDFDEIPVEYSFENETNKVVAIEVKIATLAEIEVLKTKLQQVKIKRDKEKQFNLRRQLNDDYKALKKQLAQLQASV